MLLYTLRLKRFRFVIFLICFFLGGCGKTPSQPQRTVYIEFKNNRYSFVRNGVVFNVKGAAGFTELDKLSQAGGNTIRTWDTVNLGNILTRASKYKLAVIVGLPMPDNHDMDSFYNNEFKTAEQYKSYRVLIDKYKNNPAVLCWCLGNELAFPYKPSYNKFYKTFNKLVDMIHQRDPNHPVTTTMVNFQPKNIFNIEYRTDIDFISFNIFGALKNLGSDLNSYRWMWRGPFLITEWGIDGPWSGNEKTAWGSCIENSSTKKAEQYWLTYKQYMPVNNPRFLGSLVFYWGQKQETTPTWFSFFDERGAKSEAVKIIHVIWTSKPDTSHMPQVKHMLLNDKGARDNILLSPHSLATARLYMAGSDTSSLTYEWVIQPEDWYKIGNQNNEKRQKNLTGLLINDNKATVNFYAPTKQGAYRIYVYVRDKAGNFATCNTPFYVVTGP